MKTKKKANNLKDQWEYKEEIFAVYHFDLPKMTALMTAALKGQVKMVKFLLLFQKKANIFLKDDGGWTALHYAVQGGNIEIIELFLSKGLNINGTGDGGRSPLMTAVYDTYSGKSFPNGKDEIIQFLLNNKASINYQDKNGNTALMVAVDAVSDLPDLEIIKLLIKNGADVNLKNNDGYTALDEAAGYENQAVIDYLVAKGAKGKYVGQWKDGQPNGQGTKTYPDGSEYVGEFKDGKRNGQGTLTTPDGSEYVGEWKDDNCQNGQGTGIMSYPYKGEYVGQFKNGKPNGQGKMTLQNGEEYVGQWKNGKFISQ